MSFNSVLYAGIVTFVTLLISYPTALFLTRLKHRQLWLMLIILPTWINLLLKAYAFIGIFGQNGSINQFLEFIGIGSQQLLFTDFSFIFVASYIELPFMICPFSMSWTIWITISSMPATTSVRPSGKLSATLSFLYQ